MVRKAYHLAYANPRLRLIDDPGTSNWLLFMYADTLWCVLWWKLRINWLWSARECERGNFKDDLLLVRITSAMLYTFIYRVWFRLNYGLLGIISCRYQEALLWSGLLYCLDCFSPLIWNSLGAFRKACRWIGKQS